MKDPLDAACHCGAVQFHVTLTDGLNSACRCDCSFCTMRGAVAVTAPLEGIKINSGEDQLRLYQFNTRVAKHWFCATCGIYTHHQRRSEPNEIGVNLACLKGNSPFDLAEIIVNDGQLHPSDGGDPNGIAGVLRYTKSKDAL